MIEAVEMTDEGLNRYPVQMLKWAKYIEKEIHSLLGYKIKSVSKSLTGCYFDLPSDCYHVIGMVPGNYEDECNMQYRDLSEPLIQDDMVTDYNLLSRNDSMLWIPVNTTWVREMWWEEIGDQLHMIDTFTDQEMTLIYQYIKTDQKGYWIVNESHIDAIAKYIVYMYAKKYRWKMFKSDKLLRQGHILTLEDLKSDYNIAVRHARAEDGKESPFEQEQY